MIAHTITDLAARAAHHPFLQDHLTLDANGHVIAQFAEIKLGSAYEPIFDISVNALAQSLSAAPHSAERFGDELGFQAQTLRQDHTQKEPRDARDPFGPIASETELVTLDRLSRAMHAFNFFGAQRHGLLFLRVHERLLKSVKYDHGRHFSTVLLSFGLNPARIVIELPSAAVAHRTFLEYLTKSYQRHGFRVAGNLPNAGQIMSMPDMARLDFIMMDASSALRDAVVKPLAGYAKRLRIPLIFTGISNEAQFELLRQFDVQFVQGPLFSPPLEVRR
ncbi:EAL domain-containing protein [Paraburkholderia bonniea]|uniref:EAL domain-containing protein n=1 Tax=Paraburkholderia bonniea TaxID=2152891 RepID=UPI001290E66A|nr:EAL domain-containing protein [Paraburkholderia bonniea]WJF90855.1 EAL domain-containing protein [Paraburkholderia bonniea]WJF94169.1 EAL domain-containing protein [Paraburkholderia bonniea]